MKDGGRLAAAIEILGEVESARRPVQDALRDWGRAHRFAGSGDRLVIANLVFDALRRRLSLAALMGEDSPRSLVLATYVRIWGLCLDGLAAALDGDRFAPPPPSEEEESVLEFAFGIGEHSRLACQILMSDALDGIEITVPAPLSAPLSL